MQKFVPIDYLADLPLPEITFGGSKVLQVYFKYANIMQIYY